MPSSFSARAAGALLLLPVLWLACGGGETLNPATTSTSTSTSSTGNAGGGGASTTSSSASTSSTTSTGGTGGATTSSTTSSTASTSTSSTTSSTSSTTSSTASTSSTSGTGGGLAGTRVRVAAANLTSGTMQSYDPGEGIRILQGVHPDVILMQEMNYGDNSQAKLQSLVTQVCGASCVYARGTGTIPNGVVSAYPILASGTWTDPKTATRDFTWARIDVPGPVDLWAVSVNLLTTSTTVRDEEAMAIVSQLAANVPTGDYLVLGGDFNTDVRTEPMITTLSARLVTASPYPADQSNNDNTSKPRTRPYDWNLASPELAAREAPVVIGAAMFAHGLVVDTRVYTPIADLAPALAGDSGASGMQHMAVVRDFLLE